MRQSRIGKLEQQQDGSWKWRPLTATEAANLAFVYEAWVDAMKLNLKSSRTVH